MNVTTEITDDALDDLTDDEPEVPTSLVYGTIGASSGMRWSGAVHLVGDDMTPEDYAEALVSAMHGAARVHGPATAAALRRWLVEPDDLEVV